MVCTTSCTLTHQENSIRKDAANLPDAIKIPCPSPLSNRPSSLPAFPLSPLTQDPRNSSSLLKQINSPLVRAHLRFVGPIELHDSLLSPTRRSECHSCLPQLLTRSTPHPINVTPAPPVPQTAMATSPKCSTVKSKMTPPLAGKPHYPN